MLAIFAPTRIAVLAFGLVTSACGPASYHVLRPAPKDSGAPQTFGPSPAPTPPPVVNPPPPPAAPLGPTARVVVMQDSQSVTTINANTAGTIQPSWDSFSPSFVATSTCTNPGIVRADYIIVGPDGVRTPATATRATGTCQALGVPYTFVLAGNYAISMTVTDQNSLLATASMTLTALDGSKTDGGFAITAVPMLTIPTSPIAFTGYCYMPPGFSIAWKFGDGASATGITATHPYAATGQYLVNATCTSADNQTVKTASVTVVVTDQQPRLPPATNDTPVGPRQPPNQGPNQGPNQSPNQGPNQSPHQSK